MIARRALAWSHGTLAVQSLAGMLGPVLFVLPDGRQVAPLHVAPWGNDAEAAALSPILQALRGEWPCVPFGFDAPRALPAGWTAGGETFEGAEELHGPGSNAHWTFCDTGPERLVLELVYPETHPVHYLRRTIVPDPAAPAIDLTLEVAARRECRLPAGLHPTFRLTPRPGSVTLEPGAHGAIWSHPIDFEPGATLIPPGARFASLAAAPLAAGGTGDFAHLPRAEDTEELLQMTGASGDFALHYRDEGFRVRLTWEAAVFPSVILWVSNRGRSAWPWAGRHLALGVEPICGAFDLGPATASAPNPLSASGEPTALALDPDMPLVTRYRIAVEPA